jgi:hypothetical protein
MQFLDVVNCADDQALIVRQGQTVAVVLRVQWTHLAHGAQVDIRKGELFVIGVDDSWTVRAGEHIDGHLFRDKFSQGRGLGAEGKFLLIRQGTFRGKE